MRKIITPWINVILGLVDRIDELEKENRLLRARPPVEYSGDTERLSSDLEEFSQQVPEGSQVRPIKGTRGKHSEEIQEALAHLSKHRINRDSEE